MSEFFPNAPLVELAVEFRWTLESTGDTSNADEALDAFATVDYDELHEPLYKRLRAGLAKEGFGQSERIVPKGFPTPPYMAVYRCLKADDEASVLYHFGPGVFSVNAIPPYRNWEKFRPDVEVGLRVILGAWDRDEDAEFSRIALRYIDAFSEDFLEGKSRFEFVTSILGFGLSLPPAIAALSENAEQLDAFIQYSVALKGGSELAVRAGEATVNNEKVVILDLAIHSKTATPATLEASFGVLDSAHEVINASFVEMTSPVSHVLRRESS